MVSDAPHAASAAPLDPQMEKAVREARRLLNQHGLSEVGDRAWDTLNAPPAVPALVVIGEVKRGKSSLVNALLGVRDLSPVNADIATSTYIRFVPEADLSERRRTTLLFAGDRRRTVPLEDLANWVTVDGDHVADARVDELPIGAEVSMTSPWLPNVAVVDTPGVGGLNPTHLRLATDAATHASVLLIACDASAPITGPELEFLQKVSAEVESVAMAVTKIDKSMRTWRSIVDENRRLLREHAPRYSHIPIVGVSSRRALAALDFEDGESREAKLHSSGFRELIEQLQRLCGSGEQHATVNALRIMRSGLERASSDIDLQRTAAEGSAVVIEELTAEKARLQSLKDEAQSGWRDFVVRDLNSVQHSSVRLLDQKLDGMKRQWGEKLNAAKWEVLRKSPQLFVADMTADLEVLIAEVSDHYVADVAKLVRDLGDGLDVSVEKLSTARTPNENVRRPGVGDPQMLMMGIIGGNTLGGGALAALGVTGVALWPACIAIGGAWVAVNLGYRALKSGRQQLEQWLRETIAAVRSDVVQELNERGNTLRPEILDGYRRQLTESIAQLQQLISQANAAAKASRTEREKALAELDAQRKSVTLAMAGVDAQLSRLTQSRSAATS